LDGIGTRIVDHPFIVARAEVKQWQLAAARGLGIRVPATHITNCPETARDFTSGRRIIAKALSPGIGIAPFVAEVFDTDLDAVRALPTLLQELVPASADIRVVVVGRESWVWRRPREAGAIDWRQADPAGAAFELRSDEELGTSACEVTAALGLSLSVQDWLETPDGHVFLESNAVGAWLFLPESHRLVAPAIARHLRGRNDE
jgi:glutathione synthase/RimK-type ligase-like ATP-grasp enzyme